jgi:hypothetical protein
VHWNAPTSNGGAAIISYTLRVIGPSVHKLVVVSPRARAFTVTGLLAGKSYSIRLAATNGVGIGPYSSPKNVTTHR